MKKFVAVHALESGFGRKKEFLKNLGAHFVVFCGTALWAREPPPERFLNC